MKKLFLAMLFTGFAGLLFAQPGGGGAWRRSPEERVARMLHVLDSAFKLTDANKAVLDTSLKVLYRAQDAKRQELMAGGTRPDRETILAEMKKYSDAQDEILKAVLTQEQFGTWKDKIEPAMRPQRGPGGSGGPGGGGQ
jgi:hypothetical protein